MFYIFHGEDTHSQQETLGKLKTQLGDPEMLGLNTTRLAGKGLDVAALQQACATVPFLAPVRLVIVEGFLSQPPPKEALKALLAYLPTLPETTRLFFLEPAALSERHAILALADENERGYARLFRRPEGNELARWIRDQVGAGDGRIEPRAVHLLATNVGNDLPALANEIEKLLMYAGVGDAARPITAADVELLCPYVAEANIFDLVDALGNRNGRLAATLLHKKLAEGADPFYLFAMFVRQFRLLIQARELVEADARPPTIARRLGVHRFVAGKIHQQSQRFSLQQLEQIYAHLLDVDVAVKTGQTDMPTALDLLVVGLASA